MQIAALQSASLRVLTAWPAQANAEDAVRQMLIEFSEKQKLPEVGTVIAEDQMDDGTPIKVSQLAKQTPYGKQGKPCLGHHHVTNFADSKLLDCCMGQH